MIPQEKIKPCETQQGRVHAEEQPYHKVPKLENIFERLRASLSAGNSIPSLPPPPPPPLTIITFQVLLPPAGRCLRRPLPEFAVLYGCGAVCPPEAFL